MSGAEGIAIVGMGGLFPGAPTIDAFWRNVRAGVDATSTVPATRWDDLYFDPDRDGADAFYCRRGGFVDDVAEVDPTAFGIMPVAAADAEPDQLLALTAAAAALADAGDPHERLAPTRIGVVLGKGGYLNPAGARLDQRVRTANQLVTSLAELLPDLGPDDLARVREGFLDRLGPEHPETSIGLVPNLAASRVANRLDLRGPAYTVDAACSSAHIAVGRACDELRAGRCDLVLAGGTHHCDDVTLWSVFTQLGALSRAEAIRPFDRAADGILIGEGTGVFALRRLSDAERDGDHIYAVIRGTGVASDGRSATLMSPDVSGQVAALEQAWRESGLDPASVGLVEAHGTATPTGDGVELATLARVFGPAGDGPRAGLGSVKSMIGHAMAAAGAAGLAKTAMALHDGVLPPTLHVEDPHPDLAATRFRTVGEVEPWEVPEGRLRVAGVDAFGFGGINAHLVLEEHPSSRPDPVPAGPSSGTALGAVVGTGTGPAPGTVLALAGRDPADVRARLEAWDPTAAPAVEGEGPCRLAIVEPTERKVALARRVLEGGRPFHGRSDVWFAPEGLLTGGGRLAYLFPGVEVAFDPRVDDVAAHLGRTLPETPRGATPLEAQSRGIFAVGRLLSDAVAALGAPADVMAGHSLGEWTGQIASGMIPDAEVDAFLDRLRPGSVEVPGVTYLALGAGAEVAEELVDGLDDAHLSHDNCPHQSIVCGTVEAASVVAGRAQERKVLAQELPFRSGFHSPLFEPYVPGLARDFGDLPLRTPHTPMWSATTGAPYPDDPDEVRALSVRHLLEPVRFRTLVGVLHDADVRVFVQMGVGSLTGFVDDTLRDEPYVALAAASPKHRGMDQLRRVAAAVWAEGAAVDPVRLRPLPRPARAAAATHRPGLRLALGTRLVRGLEPLDRATVGAGRGDDLDRALAELAGDGTPAPLVDEYRTAVAESATAARTVLEALGPGPARGRRSAASAVTDPGPPPPGPAASPATTAPAPAADVPEGPPTLVEEVRLSVEDQPHWLDHAFFEQPPGWADTTDLFPLVPMTGIVEMLADAACRLVPGTVAIAIEDIRAFRWLAVAPPVTATIRATVVGERDGATLVKAGVDGHTSAVVVVAPDYPDPPAPAARPLHGEVHLPADAEGLYRERHLFHGPAYQGVKEFTRSAADGVAGVLVSQSAPGALLDNAGQLFGFWAAWRVDGDRLVLPTSLQRIALHGPLPPPGTLVDCVVNLTHIDDKTVRADLELTVDGRVWCTIREWEDRRFTTDDHLFLMLRRPQHELLAEPMPGGWVLVREGWVDTATRDVVMRRFLGRDERVQYEARNPNAQRRWLLGRVAAKDAVRAWRRDQGHGPTFPIEVQVANDEAGRPLVTGPDPADLRVSIAHTTGIGVALVREGVDVGIDVEVVEARSASFETTALTPAEAAFATAFDGDRDQFLTTVWAAKEAAAKAAGTGLQGRPQDFEVTEVVVDGSAPEGLGAPRAPVLRIGDRLVATDRVALAAPGHDPKEHVVAWTL